MEINGAQRGRGPIRILAAAGALAFLLAACGHESPPPNKPQPITQQPAAPQPQARPAPAPAPAAAAAGSVAAQPAAAEEEKPDPDKALAQEVAHALRGSLGSLADGIDVTASHGKVTLWGTVPETAKQRIAVRTATGVKGVKSVLDNMSIVSGS